MKFLWPDGSSWKYQFNDRDALFNELLECFAEDLKRVWDPTAGKTKNPNNVVIKRHHDVGELNN